MIPDLGPGCLAVLALFRDQVAQGGIIVILERFGVEGPGFSLDQLLGDIEQFLVGFRVLNTCKHRLGLANFIRVSEGFKQ